MSGHSKWHNIQAKKGKTDAARSARFSKIGRELQVAAKGNPNPDTNAKLADVIAKAKANNMPNDNIKRCIAKAAGDLEGKDFKEVTYEGYGVGGSAVIIQCLTDNTNRTVSDVRTTMGRCGGQMGNSGCVSYMFDNKGYIAIERTVDLDEDTIMEYCLEAGADDYTAYDDMYEIYTAPDAWSGARDYFEEKGVTFIEAEIRLVPQSLITLEPARLGTFKKMVARLEELDDVQEVFHNVDIPDDDDDED